MQLKKIAIVGSPNVGKSSIFNNLSRKYATVSNYPGTTVELFKTKVQIGQYECDLIDTPGMYSMLPVSEEEAIARLILIEEKPDLILHIVAAKNLDRGLGLTLQLIDAGLPVMLVINVMDEAQKDGMVIDLEKLKKILNIPVVTTISVRNIGIKELKERINDFFQKPKAGIKDTYEIEYPAVIKKELQSIKGLILKDYGLSKKLISALLLQADNQILDLVKSKEDKKTYEAIVEFLEKVRAKSAQPIEYIINLVLKDKVSEIIKKTVKEKKKSSQNLSRLLGDLILRPIIGVPLLIAFLYYGIYKLVGEFGAGFCVDFLEAQVFEGYINPFFIDLFEKIIPFNWVNDLFVGEYGIITLGVRYAVAIVLPIVGIFFFVFSFAEDTGYLPRMGALLDRLLKKIGLSGKAVIPIVLGLGCDTMATMVTRILPTKRERLIATLLLSLSIPCSAQLGVIMAILSDNPKVLLAWFLTITTVFATTGFFLNKILKGRRPSFHIELPPLRMPRISNILTKTYTRLKWYLKEVLPLFIWASVIIWVGQITKIFDFVVSLLRHPVNFIGLPDQLSTIFLFGFFRRDYGAAGLYDIEKQGILTTREVLVAAVVLTLFLPCIAQFLINIKERGNKVALGIGAFVLVFSFSVGYVLNKILILAGVN